MHSRPIRRPDYGPFWAAALSSLMSCGTGTACDLNALSADIAGPEAISCGVFQPGATLDDCAATALSSAEPFWAVQETQGIDSVVSRAWVYDGDQFWILTQDDYKGENTKVEATLCVQPQIDASIPEAVACESWLPKGNTYLVCGRVCASCTGELPLPFEHEAVQCNVKASGAVVCRPD